MYEITQYSLYANVDNSLTIKIVLWQLRELLQNLSN